MDSDFLLDAVHVLVGDIRDVNYLTRIYRLADVRRCAVPLFALLSNLIGNFLSFTYFAVLTFSKQLINVD
jgi:hypothetical protein